MAFVRQRAVAYGSPEVGTLVIGGENNAGFPLHDWAFGANDYDQLVVAIEFSVVDTTDGGFKARLAALANLREFSGDLGISGATNLSLSNLSGVVSGSTLTITDDAAGGQFATSQLGLPIDIEGVGSFMVCARTSANIVTCKLPTGLSAPANFSAKAGRIGHELLRVHHASATGGYFGRPTIKRTPHPSDGVNKQRFVMTARYEAPADDSTRDPNGRRRATMSVAMDGSERQVATFDGQYTPTKIDSTSLTTAYANYITAVDTWINTQTAGLGGVWKKVERRFSQPDETGTLAFRVVCAEQNFPDTAAAAVADDTIRNAVVAFERRQDLRSGHPSIKLSVVGVSYSCAVPKATTWENLKALWANTIKPHLLTSVATEFGGAVTEIDENCQAFVSSNAIVASMTLIVQGGGSTLVSFSKQVTYGYNPSETISENITGSQNDYTGFAATGNITAQVIIGVSRIGSHSDAGQDILTGPQSPSGDVVGGSSLNGWQAPGQPPYPAAITAAPAKKWNPRGAQIQLSREYLGHDADRKGSKRFVTSALYASSWLWGRVKTLSVVGAAAGGSPSSGPGIQAGGSSGASGFESPPRNTLAFPGVPSAQDFDLLNFGV